MQSSILLGKPIVLVTFKYVYHSFTSMSHASRVAKGRHCLLLFAVTAWAYWARRQARRSLRVMQRLETSRAPTSRCGTSTERSNGLTTSLVILEETQRPSRSRDKHQEPQTYYAMSYLAHHIFLRAPLPSRLPSRHPFRPPHKLAPTYGAQCPHVAYTLSMTCDG